MYAISVDSDRLTWTEQPDPVPGTGEVIIDIVAAGLNRADLLQRQGAYPPPRGASTVMGLECSGTIAAVGPDVSGWAVGDPVCALLAGGGYAEKVAVPAVQLLPVPRGVDLLTAASLPEAACTVWSMVGMNARLGDGELLLVHGGSGGIGSFAIQLGVALGARVAATAGTAEGLRRCAELGATVLIDYHEQDFVEAVREASDGAGADVILDVIGAKYLQRNVDALALHGRLAIIGLQGGTRAEIDLGKLLSRRLTVLAATLRSRPVDGPQSKAEIVTGVRERVWPLIESGAIRPTVGAVLPISQAEEAHRRLSEDAPGGKILLQVR